MQIRRLAIVLATASTLATGSVPSASASASAKSCKGVKDSREGRIYKVNLSSGFACADARTNLGSWLHFGAPMKAGHPQLPGGWKCGGPHTYGGFYIKYWCRLRTSFGGTRPERTYKLNFRYDPRT